MLIKAGYPDKIHHQKLTAKLSRSTTKLALGETSYSDKICHYQLTEKLGRSTEMLESMKSSYQTEKRPLATHSAPWSIDDKAYVHESQLF